MRSVMFAHVASVNTRVITELAVANLFPSVNTHMNLDVAFVFERLSADLTNVGFLIGVNSHVPREVVGIFCGETAVDTRQNPITLRICR